MPCQKIFSYPGRSESGKKESRTGRSTGRASRVLIVCQEPEIAARFFKILRKMDPDPIQFKSPRSALDYLKTGSKEMSVVVYDFASPEMNGLAFLREARKVDGLESLPFLFCSSFNDEVVHKFAFQDGFFHFVEEPIDEHHLAARVQAIVREKTRG